MRKENLLRGRWNRHREAPRATAQPPRSMHTHSSFAAKSCSLVVSFLLESSCRLRCRSWFSFRSLCFRFFFLFVASCSS